VNTAVYDKEITALLVVDPYNDFISEGGKIWPRIKAVAEANNCVAHMLEVLNAAQRAKLRVFYAMHHRYRQATMRRGNTSRPFRGGHGNTGPSNSALGAASSALNSCRRRVKL
jgi:nicotinamidase-related amidase